MSPAKPSKNEVDEPINVQMLVKRSLSNSLGFEAASSYLTIAAWRVLAYGRAVQFNSFGKNTSLVSGIPTKVLCPWPKDVIQTGIFGDGWHSDGTSKPV